MLYEGGVVAVVGCALTPSLGFAALAYDAIYKTSLPRTGAVLYATRNLYVAAAIGLFGLGSYTRLVMWDTITELSKRANSGEEARDQVDTRALVKRWGRMNLWRGVMLLGSAGIGVWASLL